MNLRLFDCGGALLNCVSNFCYIRVNMLGWPLSLIAYIVDIILCFKIGLYADVGLDCVFFILTIYGWYQWSRGGSRGDALPISKINLKLGLTLCLITIIGSLSLATILRLYTDSQVPYWDAIAAVLGLVGEWLLCKKFIENWYFWFVLNGIYTFLYFYKGIPVHASLEIVYLGFAVAGYLYWRRKYNLDLEERNSFAEAT